MLLIARTYHSIMNRNRKLLEIARKGGSGLPDEVYKHVSKHPIQFKKLLTDYFSELVKKGKIAAVDPEMTALSFMWMNYGAFSSNLLETSHSTVTLDQFIEHSVDLFARALQP
jgi:hypothetical protein